MKKLIVLSVLAANLVCLSQSLPKPIIAGYTGYFLGVNKMEYYLDNLYPKMKAAGFNSVEIKIQQNKQPYMDIKPYMTQLHTLIDGAQANGLAFQLYLYPEPGNAKKNPAKYPLHAAIPSPVDSMGKTVENTFRADLPQTWRELFKHAYQFAEASKDLPIASIKFDLETFNLVISYDDDNWRAFCATHPELKADELAAQRHQSLKEAGLLEDYEKAQLDRISQAAKALADDLHAIAPTMPLGVMPQGHTLADCFAKVLATDTVPAIIDNWTMYNGEGFSNKSINAAEEARKLHPNNLAVTWFRINSYQPEDVTASAYFAASKTDGYSMWTIFMLDGVDNKKLGYQLPKGRRPDEYFNCFKAANDALAADVRDGTLGKAERIAFKAPKPMIAELDFSRRKIPALRPDGTGERLKGSQAFLIRDQQIIYIYAKTGEEIDVSICHEAGEKRPLALQYALFSPQMVKLRNEAVMPGQTEKMKIPAPETGIYLLTVSGGIGGQAWYSVAVANPYWCLDASKEAYIFRSQTIYVPGKTFGNPQVHSKTPPSQAYYIQINDGERFLNERKGPMSFDLPDGVAKVTFSDAPIAYSQDFELSFPKGKTPYIYIAPERRLVPVDKRVVFPKKKGTP
ncbi:MAG: hypothetical protein J6X55_01820 [Victivallales bacterium]|nr:hypothetical protein [Victivallales bacterium]